MAELTPGFLRHFKACNRHDLGQFTRFRIDGRDYGWIAKSLHNLIADLPDVFTVSDNSIDLASRFADFDARSQILDDVSRDIAHHFGTKMRREMYPIIQQWGDVPLAQIDRAAVPWFGVKGFGIHVNGFVRKPDGIYLWIGERAGDRLIDPGKLDNMIGGGQPIGLSLEENVCKEAEEEAGLDATVARTAKQVSTIHYRLERHNGLRNDVLFVYDLELPADLIPRNTDGEVAGFHLLPVAEVAEIVRTSNRFKFNCNLVIIDFMIRHGFLPPDHAEVAAIRTYLDTPISA